MVGTLAGKTVVVTGSTRGIGRAIARACGREGATLVVNGRTEIAVDRAVEELRASGVKATGVAADVSKPDGAKRIYEFAIARHTGIDVWFNNAGLPGGFRPLDELTPEELLRIVDVNLGGTMLGCRLVVPYMREHGGVIVNLCGRGSNGEVAAFGATYAATKSGIASLTRSLASENRDAARLTICGLLPGMVPTAFYEEMDVSPKLADKVGNVHVALDAFGATLDEVGTFAAALAAQTPGTATGKIHSVITPTRRIRGVLKLLRARMTGRMTPL